MARGRAGWRLWAPRPRVGNRVATWLGRNSLLIYIWHYPVFSFVARHTIGSRLDLGGAHGGCHDGDGGHVRRATGWSNGGSRVATPPGWRDLDDGVPQYLALHAEPLGPAAVRPRGLRTATTLGLTRRLTRGRRRSAPVPLSTTRSVASRAEVATYTEPGRHEPGPLGRRHEAPGTAGW